MEQSSRQPASAEEDFIEREVATLLDGYLQARAVDASVAEELIGEVYADIVHADDRLGLSLCSKLYELGPGGARNAAAILISEVKVSPEGRAEYLALWEKLLLDDDPGVVGDAMESLWLPRPLASLSWGELGPMLEPHIATLREGADTLDALRGQSDPFDSARRRDRVLALLENRAPG